MGLSITDIVAANDMRKAAVEIPEWGGTVYVRCMSGAEREQFDATIKTEQAAGLRVRICALCLCNEDGSRLWDKMVDGEAILRSKSAAVLERIAQEALKVNGILSSEEVEGNSESEAN